MSTHLPLSATQLLQGGPITQAQLRRYLELKASTDKATMELSQLRELIVQKIEASIPIEPETLTAILRTSSRRVLDGPRLIPLLGEAKVEELRDLVVPLTQKSLYVQAAW